MYPRFIRRSTEMGSLAMFKRRLALGVVSFIFLVPLLHAEDFFFDSAGVKIHYTVEGKGEPVLLIHGFGADIQANWSAPGIIKELSDAFQVIAIDNRGHGKSEKPHDPRAYGMQMVEDSLPLLDHLRIQKAHVVGYYSMGGRITCAIVGYHTERLRSAVLGGYGWYPPAMILWMPSMSR
jgi:pimeloyl-ACP methyl ester carboxylesterase